MKAICAVLFVTILVLTSVIVAAEPLQGYGTKVPLQGPDMGTYLWVDWSPDGNWIAVTFFAGLETGAYLFPISGENPVQLVDGYSFNIEFTADSQHIFVNNDIWEEQYGAIIEDLGNGHIRKSNGLQVIDKVNIYTGATETVAHGTLFAHSPDGRYLIYENRDYRVHFDDLQEENHLDTAVLDMTTGEKSYIPQEIMSGPLSNNICSFSPDSKYLIFSKFMAEKLEDYKRQLWITTIKDGTIDFENAEQITFENESPWSKYRDQASFSPNGEWIIHTASQLTEKFCVESINFNGEKTGESCSGGFSNLVAVNLISGEEIVLLPENKTKRPLTQPSFTDKGDQICYVLKDMEDQRNGGVYILDLPEALKGAPTFVEESAPQNFMLISNYPNPFNPSTTIEFSLPEAGFADLVIFNLAGQKIRELLSGTMSEGIHSAVWNGRDDRGLPVSAGVYLARLKMNDTVVTGRMILVK